MRSVRTEIKCMAVIAVIGAISMSPNAWAADSWNGIHSKNFEVVGEVGYGTLAKVAETLEEFRLATTRLFSERTLQSPRPLTVVVVGAGSIKNYGQGPSGNVGGYYQSTYDRDYIVMAD